MSRRRGEAHWTMERGVLPQRFDVHGADCVSASFLVVVTGTGVAHLLVHALSVQLFDFRMSYLKDVDQSVWSAYLKQGLEDLQRILDSTRPVGQQFYQGKHVWNNRMLTEAQVLKELQSNSIFTTACGLVDAMLCEKEATVMDAKMTPSSHGIILFVRSAGSDSAEHVICSGKCDCKGATDSENSSSMRRSFTTERRRSTR